MSHALVLLWLGTSTARAAHQPDLDSWQRAHQVALTAPASDGPAARAYDPALARRIERLLDEARIAAGSLDETTALSRLARVDRLLHDRPELPQSAWLMAERLEIEADVYERRADGAVRAARLRQHARSLEGRRARSYTTATETHTESKDAAPPPAPASTAAPTKPQRVVPRGLSAGDRLYVDARLVRGRLLLEPGEHHARVVRHHRAVWAGWVRIAAGDATLALPVPAAGSCSLDDVDGTRVRDGRVVAPRDVHCRRWAVAVASEHDDGVRVAICDGSSCGPLLRWRRDFGRGFTGPAQPAEHHGWPSWATYLLAGVGVAATTSLVLWQTGAFDRPSAPRTVWKYSAPLVRF